ncbi:hypothetical protein CGH20_13735 [Vibrio parahaemolyticus]|nr:hypothetical protein CGH63_08080 [Vibrio parahaemolyticus]TOO40230.1 hypothetical protein CGH39_15345 [Vibrio parahaemolyticus]TOP29922.1 hypothetical protein CGH20_13735 [Vibrio parahaemolyticus]
MKSTKKAPTPCELVKHIMVHRRCDRADAEAWADKNCGDWRNTPLPRAKRIESISSNEKEWEE